MPNNLFTLRQDIKVPCLSKKNFSVLNPNMDAIKVFFFKRLLSLDYRSPNEMFWRKRRR